LDRRLVVVVAAVVASGGTRSSVFSKTEHIAPAIDAILANAIIPTVAFCTFLSESLSHSFST